MMDGVYEATTCCQTVDDEDATTCIRVDCETREGLDRAGVRMVAGNS